MGKEILRDQLRELVAYGKANDVRLVDDIAKIPAASYTDPALFEAEKQKVFRRLPLMLAPSCEIPQPGMYKAMTVADVPVLITRKKDGSVGAFLNSCTHRGNPVATDTGLEAQKASRFVCSYHGWTFTNEGKLMGVGYAQDFGTVDKAENCLKAFPVLERAGLIWVILDPESTLSIEAYLCGYDAVLETFGFADWHLFESRQLPGPNWKVAYDGYLDFYHLPVLHKDTFGADFPNRAHFYAWGPHQRVASPSSTFAFPNSPDVIDLTAMDEADWPDPALQSGVWTIFPHISIAGFDGGGERGVMLSQLLPGADVDSSITRQYYLLQNEPSSEEARKGAHDQFSFLEHVVANEDYATGIRQQNALKAGILKEVMFGRNEGGGQAFHHWLHRVVSTPDDELDALFALPMAAE
ncbi:MAG: aromatic ring-hydroxylating dioxygenase subunit alpha [Sphingomonadales bacterium]